MSSSWQYGEGEPITEPTKVTEYRSKVSSLSYFVQVTRPDLAFAVNSLSRWMHKPNPACFQALDDVCSYLHAHPDIGLHYTANRSARIHAFADASWAGPDSIQAKSVTGNLIFYGDDLLSWESSLQKSTPALSPAEAEFNSAFEAARSLVYTQMLFDELGYPDTEPALIYEDNTACIQQAKHPVNFKRSRHINLRYHYMRELTGTNQIDMTYVPTAHQLADALTKPLPGPQFQKLTAHFMQRCPR